MYSLALLPVLLSPAWADPAPPPPPAGGLIGTPPPRVHVHDEAVVACPTHKKDLADETATCPALFTAVETAPLKTGPVVLKTWVGEARPGDTPCEWQTLATRTGLASEEKTPRSLTVLPLDSAQYRRTVGELVGQEQATLTALVKVDLQGDGSDEVLFAAESHGSPADQPWPFPSQGKVYSVVGMRRVVDGAVQTHLFFEHRRDLDTEDMEMVGAMAYQRGTLLGVTDVDGDGVLEVVVGDGYYEGSGVRLWSAPATGAPKVLGETGCGA